LIKLPVRRRRLRKFSTFT